MTAVYGDLQRLFCVTLHLTLGNFSSGVILPRHQSSSDFIKDKAISNA